MHKSISPTLPCMQAAAIQMSGDGSDGHSIESTFDVMFVTGWAPDPSQAKPARRGSATASFSDLQGTAQKTQSTADQEVLGSEEHTAETLA